MRNSSAPAGRLEEEVRRFLDGEVPAEHPNRRYVEAVVLHLGSGPTAVLSQMDAAAQVVRIVHPPYNTDPSRLLLRHPALMASLFQNADLLDRSDPASAALARTVMKAMEEIEN